jgi:type II secretory pathway pseudopilin PulG
MKREESGYTLLEALVALGIFLMVFVPLIGRFGAAGNVSLARDKVIAMCLAEQEAALVKAFPDQAEPAKRRQAGGQEWLVRTEVSPGPLRQCVVTVSRGQRKCGEVRFYVYRP